MNKVQIINLLREHNYKVKIGMFDEINARKNNIKIEIFENQASAWDTTVRFQNVLWKRAKYNFRDADVAWLINILERLAPKSQAEAKIMFNNVLKEGFKFGPAITKSGDDIIHNVIISQVKVISMVSVNEDGKLNTDITTPGRQVWFLLSCSGFCGATFNIISDGKMWIPTIRISKESKIGEAKITFEFNPKATLNLGKMSITDMLLINEAIIEYKRKIGT